MTGKPTSEDLLKDDDVRRWFENLGRGSTLTARERLRVLARFCRLMETTPTKMVEDVRDHRKSFEDSLMDFLGSQIDAGRKPGYLGNYLKAVRSWLDYHGLTIQRRIKLGNMRATPTLTDEQIPSGEQLKDLLLAATLRGRVVISLMAFSGLRPGILGNQSGTDGLRLGDLLDLEIANRGVGFVKLPVLVRVRTELSKAAHPFLTLLGEEGLEHLRRYLQERLDGGEELHSEAPVVRCAPGFETMGKRDSAGNRGSPFIVTGNITGDVREAMDRCRWRARPYVLRRYFETRLLEASWKGELPRDFVTFWAGHKGDIEHVYALHKGLPPSLVEEMRQAYRRGETFLSTTEAMMRTQLDLETAAREELAERLAFQEKMTNAITGILFEVSPDAVRKIGMLQDPRAGRTSAVPACHRLRIRRRVRKPPCGTSSQNTSHQDKEREKTASRNSRSRAPLAYASTSKAISSPETSTKRADGAVFRRFLGEEEGPTVSIMVR